MAHKKVETTDSLLPMQPAIIQPTEQVDIQRHIFTIRGTQVMVDRDLAELYGVETRRINEQVKRHIDRFPERFMFQLNEDEFAIWKSQIATSNWKSHTATSNYIKMGIRRAPYVFTEQGVAMLATVLNSKEAAQISISIMDAFVAMRHFIVANAQIFQRLESLETFRLEAKQGLSVMEHKFDDLLNRLDDGSTKPIEGVFVEGQVLDARVYFEQLISSANREVVLIDGYVDATTFHILESRAENVKATLYTEAVGDKILGLIVAHDTQYPNRKIEVKKYRTHFHDRFLIIDDTLYHLGASLKDAGKRLFAFEKMGIDKRLILGQL